MFGRGRTLHVSHLDKLYFEKAGVRKGDLMRYYAQIAPFLLPIIKDRPLVLKRYPNGAGGPSFFQQNVPAGAPRVVRTAELEIEDGSSAHRVIGGDLATLLYLVQIGTIAVHSWQSRLTTIDDADYSTIDLDPGDDVAFDRVVELAALIRQELDAIGIGAALKTSGSSGLHIVMPLPRGTSYETSAALAERIAERMVEAHPRLATLERRLDKRPARTIYVDAQQNARGKTVVSAYSVRARENATVSTPLRWEELRPGLRLDAFTVHTVPARVARLGDLWGRAMARRNSAHTLARALQQLDQ